MLFGGQRDLKIKMLLWDAGTLVSNIYRLLDYLEVVEGRISVDALLEREKKRVNAERQTAPQAEEGSVRYLMEVPNPAINWDWLFNWKVYPELSPLLPGLEKEDWLIIRDGIIAPMKYRYLWFKYVEEKMLYFHNIEMRLSAPIPEELTVFLVTALRNARSQLGNSTLLTLLMLPRLVQQLATEWYNKKASGVTDKATFMRTNFPTHHQKIVLADYEIPQKARALVMGNNIRETDVDSFPQVFDTPAEGGRYPGPLEFVSGINRPRLYRVFESVFAKMDAQRKTKGDQQEEALEDCDLSSMFLNEEFGNSRSGWQPSPLPPRQDISCSVRGPVLYDINNNFMENWIKAGGGDFRRNQSIRPENFVLPKDMAPGTAQFSVTRLLDNKLGPIFKAYETAFKASTRFVYFENQYFRSRDIAAKLLECAENRKANRSHEHGEPLYYFAVVNAVDNYAMDSTYKTMQTLGHEEQMPREHRRQLVRERDRLLAEGVEKDDERITDLNRRIDEADTLLQNIKAGDRKTNSSTSPGNIENPEEAFGLRQAHECLKGHIGTMMVCKSTLLRYVNPENGRASLVPGCIYKDVNIHSKLLLADDVFAIIGSANMHDRGLMSDAESVIGSTQQGLALGLRKKLFYNLTDRAAKDDDLPGEMYDAWKEVMDENWRSRYARKPLKGALNYLYVFKYIRLPTLD